MFSAQKKIQGYLEKANPAVFNIYCIFAAFTTYFCMYAFRKPFSVGTFDYPALEILPQVDYKVILIIAQVFGYTLSKFLGIKVVSELEGNYRGRTIIGLILFAELSLLLFGIVPAPYNILCLFLNGIPLGMIWGLVFGYLEGRKSTELLGAGLSASYIVASGAVKSVGRWVLSLGISEFWMPFITGAFFFPVILFSVFLLKAIPKPTKEDIELRTKRTTMSGNDRWKFFKTFYPGLIPLTLLYMLLTAYRDFRDNFAREIWDALGYQGQPAIFTLSELPIAFAVLIALATLMLIKNNKKGLLAIHLIMIAGTAIIGITTFMFQLGMLDPAVWMVSVGLGLYLGYVPYGCVLFDRLIAATGFVGTAGFMIYVTDAFGYLGSVGLMLYKNFGHPNLSWLQFFIGFSYATAIFCTVSFIFSLGYFTRTKKTSEEDVGELQELTT